MDRLEVEAVEEVDGESEGEEIRSGYVRTDREKISCSWLTGQGMVCVALVTLQKIWTLIVVICLVRIIINLHVPGGANVADADVLC